MAAIAALVATGAGVVTSALGKKSAGDEQNAIDQANAASTEKVTAENVALEEAGTAANAGIQDYNATLQDAQSADALRQGLVAETLERQQVKGVIGTDRTDYAAGNVEINSGSALAVQASSAYQGELQALTIRTDAARTAWGYQVTAENYRMQAAAIRTTGALQAQSIQDAGDAQALSESMSGQLAQQQGDYGAAATILSGAGNILNQAMGASNAQKAASPPGG